LPVDVLLRLAELSVVLGANVQPDQVVLVVGDVAHVALVRAVAEAAYRQGARFVDVDLADSHVHRSRVLHARDDTLGYVAAWPEARIHELAQAHGAGIRIVSPPPPGLYEDVDAARVDRAQPPLSRAWREVEYRVNNTIIPGPTEAWAQALRPDLAAAEALAGLWDDISVACRLADPDPVVSWRRRFADLRERARALTALRLDAVRLRGPGTDLVVGLPPTARWEPPTHVNEGGIEHVWNLPSEEVYTVPDRDRADGVVRLTSPAVVGGRLAHDVKLTFRGGRVVSVAGSEGVDALCTYLARDEGTTRLGELALVDGASAVASLGRTFGLILLDENRASHIALGFGFPALVEQSDRDRINTSGDHLDVSIGSDQVEVTGIDVDGREHRLLCGGIWQHDP
jgi:aminopeptidase